MSERGRPDLSPTQLVAGGLATATATVATSYLGVAGTLIGAAFMSVVTTAGAAVYQHYLDRGKRRYVTLVTTESRHHVAGRPGEPAESRGEPAATANPANPANPAEAGKSAEPTRKEPAEAEPAGSTRPAKSAESAESAGSTRPAESAESTDETAQLKESAAPPPDGAHDTIAQPRRPRWYVLAGAALAIFAVVIGGITLVEALANKPVSAMLGKSDRSGTSLGETFGDGGSAPTRQPVVPSSTAPASPSTTATATATPSRVSSRPTTAPVPPPESPSLPSAPATTRPPAPTPTTPGTQSTAP
ncbi:MAG TPA: hypothetical protein VE465_28745 [Streptosporangiaceae bacterium]|jgi:hypothetical protein|nr:hypothetical protein [Streptosporangiaceae bacterium]